MALVRRAAALMPVLQEPVEALPVVQEPVRAAQEQVEQARAVPVAMRVLSVAVPRRQAARAAEPRR